MPTSNLCSYLDVIALIQELPELGLYRGQVGTIVEVYEPGIFEVEFCDMQGKTYVLETLRDEQIMVFHHQPLAEGALL